MSVLIKGMTMPENCDACPMLFEYRFCALTDDHASSIEWKMEEKRMLNCPLIGLPDHGDLIDKDELYRKTAEWEEQARNQVNEGWTKWNIILTERTAFKFDVADAPVVIPAERSEDE